MAVLQEIPKNMRDYSNPIMVIEETMLLLLCGVELLTFLGVSALTNLPTDKDVIAVFVGFRHGDRHPSSLLPDDPNKGKGSLEGEAQLSNIGQQQAYALGAQLRARYRTLVSDYFFVNETWVVSSDADRCQMTAQCVLRGFYQSMTRSMRNACSGWQPFPVYLDKPLLRMYDVNECLAQTEAWNIVNNAQTPEGHKIYKDNENLIYYLSNVTGWSPTLSKMADIADNLAAMKLRNLTLPTWVTDNPFKKNLLDDVLQFSEIPQKLCAMYTPCRWLMAGYWMNDIVSKMQQKANGTTLSQRMFVYSSHNEILTSLLWILGVEELGVPYNAAIIFELKTQPSLQVHVLYSIPATDKPDARSSSVLQLPYCTSKWCTLDQLIRNVKPFLVPDYKVLCQHPVCCCTPASMPPPS